MGGIGKIWVFKLISLGIVFAAFQEIKGSLDAAKSLWYQNFMRDTWPEDDLPVE